MMAAGDGVAMKRIRFAGSRQDLEDEQAGAATLMMTVSELDGSEDGEPAAQTSELQERLQG